MQQVELTKSWMEFIISRLIERAREAIDEYNSSSGDDKIFESGRKMAYFEVLDILKSELKVRDQDPEEYGLENDLMEKLFFSPESKKGE